MNLESAPLHRLYLGSCRGRSRRNGFRRMLQGEGLITGSQWWLSSIVLEETEQICSCQTCLRNRLKATHEAKGKGRQWETPAEEQVCLHGQEMQRTAWSLHGSPKAPIPVPTSFQPTPISFPGGCGRTTLAKPSSHYLLRQRCDICISWCIGYFLIAVKDCFGSRFLTVSHLITVGKTWQVPWWQKPVLEPSYIMVDQEEEKERGQKYRLQPGICWMLNSSLSTDEELDSSRTQVWIASQSTNTSEADGIHLVRAGPEVQVSVCSPCSIIEAE